MPVADGHGLVGRPPDPDCEKDRRYSERRHLYGDPDDTDGSRLLREQEAGREENGKPTWDAATSPEGDPEADWRYELGEGVEVGERVSWSGVEVRDQDAGGCVARHVGRAGSRKVDADEDVDNCATEDSDPPKKDGLTINCSVPPRDR